MYIVCITSCNRSTCTQIHLTPLFIADSTVNLTASLVTDSVVIMEWTLPPLAIPPPNIELPTEFDINGYSISIDGTKHVDLEGRDNAQYLFNGLSGGAITFGVTVEYSRAEIISGESTLLVVIPDPGGKYVNVCVYSVL